MSKNRFVAFTVMMLLGSAAYAMPTAGGAVLPWDAPLALLVTSVTGIYAFAAATTGMVIAGSILVFGNDLNRFGQSIMYLILVIGMIVLGVNGLAALFTTGAVIGASTMMFAVATGTLIAMATWLTGIQFFIVKAIKSLIAKPEDIEVPTAA